MHCAQVIGKASRQYVLGGGGGAAEGEADFLIIGRAKRALHWGVQSRFRVI